LDGVGVAQGEERFEWGDPSLWVVEVDKERPLDEPRAGVKLGEGRFWEVVGVGGCRGEEGGRP